MNNNMMSGVPIVETNEKKNGNGGLILFIAILIIGLIASCGYIVYDKMNSKEVVKKSTKEALETVNLEDNYLFQVEDSINAFEYAYNYSQSTFFGYIYKKNKLTASEFNVDAALFACIHPYLEGSNNISYVADSTVKTKFKSIFGNKLSYSPSKINAGANYFINYADNYYSVQRLGEGGYYHPTYLTSIENVLVEKDEIQVVKNVGYIEYTENNTKYSLFTDSNKNGLIITLPIKEGAYSEAELLAKYKSKLSQYTYTFVLDDNKFVFDSIKRTK